jgi:hypothetical protein
MFRLPGIHPLPIEQDILKIYWGKKKAAIIYGSLLICPKSTKPGSTWLFA